MPREVMTDYVSSLLNQLQDAKRISAKQKWERPMFTDNMVKKMERDLMFVNDIFFRLERWENDVKEALRVIARFLDDMLDDGLYEAKGLEFQLRSINRKVSDLKEHVTPPLHLPPLATDESKASSLPNTTRSPMADHHALQDFAFVGRNPGLPLHVSYVWQNYGSAGLPSTVLASSPRTCLMEPATVPEQSITVSPRFNPNRFLTCFNANRRKLAFGMKEFMSVRNVAVLQLANNTSTNPLPTEEHCYRLATMDHI
ncbi:hypothetical protein J5N97_011890 [Dioscorea zingiberensis]|uniref:Uncharacterized protein n=1 Tax=Dioscorea zingiberensis TaxID=325984 RepID=A0A9D5D3Y0_9LILI|nr:hypothetical protein J5N97_011890 [Dioscorea zingiberensis]